MGEKDSGYAQPAVPKFEGHYEHWKMLMQNLLQSKDYWEVVENGIPQLAANATPELKKIHDEAKLKDFKAKNYLFQAIERGILESILKIDTSKDIWESMKQKYQGSNKVKHAQLQALKHEWESLMMKEDESVSDYFSRTLSIANKMKSHGKKVKEKSVVEKILRSMTMKYDYVVFAIEQANDVEKMSIDALQSSIFVQEARMKGRNDEEQVLKVSNPSNSSNSSNSARGRGRGRGAGRGRGRQMSKDHIECYKCKKMGHYQSECPNLESNVANYAEFDEDEEILLMATSDDKEGVKKWIWFLDSGCSTHMCGTKEWFVSFDAAFRETVKVGDGRRLLVEGKGCVKLKIEGRVQVISGVYYVPTLKSNLLSIGQLQQKKLKIVFEEDKCLVYHKEKGLIITSHMAGNRMFAIKAEMIQTDEKCFQVTKEEETELWHKRYAHLGHRGLLLLKKEDMVKGLPALSEAERICADCQIGKQHREKMSKQSNWRASRKLELVHSDICGPITPESNSKIRYFITFIDDYTRKSWVYFLKEKSAAFYTFKKFKSMVEKECNGVISCLRTDRGGEFNSKEFIDFCSENGIRRQLTAAFTPQQNGVAERKNRTVMNLVRCLLHDSKLPKSFWPEATKWSFYVLDRSPTVAVKNITPQEAWSEVKPSVKHFRVFGCIAYMHIPDSQRKKLDDKSRKCIFLGVSEESKAYRLNDPITKKVMTSRDVNFDEMSRWDWDQTGGENSNCELDDNTETLTNEEVVQPSNSENSNNDSTSSQSLNQERREVARSDNDDNDVPGAGSDSSLRQLPARQTKTPSWWQDFHVTGVPNPKRNTDGDGLNDDSDLHSLVVFDNMADPLNYDEACKDERWKEAMNVEIRSIERNGTWILEPLPDGAKKIGVKWVFKTKYNEEGRVEKYKARLVAKGYSQRAGVDFSEVFAPVARWDTIRSVLSVAAGRGWQVYQLDVKSAFLHGELEEVVYVEQPEGYIRKGKERHVYKLKKALYGLRQAPRAWYSRIDSYFTKEGFNKCPHEHTLYTKRGDKDNLLIVSLYVDDLIYTGSNSVLIENFRNSMKKEFEMSDLGKMRYFLGVEVIQNDKGIFVTQQKYTREVLERFGMQDSKPVGNPVVTGTKLKRNEERSSVDPTSFKQLVGSLMYLNATRPDIMFGVSLISRFMDNPAEEHLIAAKRICRYLRGTVTDGILYQKGRTEELTAYCDSDYAGDVNDRRSTSGYVFMLNGGAISWSSKKQPIVTLSTTEAEYVAAAHCVCQGVWMQKILEEISGKGNDCLSVFCDNSSTIKLAKNPVFHGRSKHIDVRFHFLRELVNSGYIELKFCSSQNQFADILTKGLKIECFNELKKKIGMCSIAEIQGSKCDSSS